jgi:Domain of unknown function (DUF3883)
MYPDVLKSEKFAQAEQITFLLNEGLSQTRARSIEDIASFCEEKSVSLLTSLKETLELLKYLGFINHDDRGKFYKNNSEASSPQIIYRRIVEMLFSNMATDGLVSSLIAPESIEYDPSEDAICVRNNFISLDFSALKNLLISIGFFGQHNIANNLLRVSENYRNFFEESIIPAIKNEKFSGIQTHKLSLAALKRIQEANEINGREAEDFVLSYERRRVDDPEKYKKIRIISDLQCDAGYDIASFNDSNSYKIDRFIEVKSFLEKPTFFWSENEVATAMVKREEYFLYLVDRQISDRQGYEPIIIKNPYESIFLNEREWKREAKTWFFHKN